MALNETLKGVCFCYLFSHNFFNHEPFCVRFTAENLKVNIRPYEEFFSALIRHFVSSCSFNRLSTFLVITAM